MARRRHDGFTPKKRKRFLAALTKTGCLANACRKARISDTSVNRWRAKDAGFDR